jgi:hypothetical protein
LICTRRSPRSAWRLQPYAHESPGPPQDFTLAPCDNLALFFDWPGNHSGWRDRDRALLYRLDQLKSASTLNRFYPFNWGMADVQ